MTIKEALKDAQDKLIKGNIIDPKNSAEFLICQVLKYDKAKLYANLDATFYAAAQKVYKRYIAKRLKHEPVWYITKSKVNFYGNDFFVSKDCLIPRPETEFLVHEVLERIKNYDLRIKNENLKKSPTMQQKKFKILDIGTGSGAIIISIAKTIANDQRLMTNDFLFFASDISEKALKIAEKNVQNLGLSEKILLKRGYLFEPWKTQKFDVITANLPYIPHEDLGSLALDIHHYEPRVSLDGGSGGLVIYEEFLKNLPRHLNKGGSVFCEIGKSQGNLFKKIALKYLNGAKIEIKHDFADFDRIAIIRFN